MKRGNAFTLIELLVVIAIIAVLAAIGVPAYRKAIDSSQRARCTSNLRSIYIAMGSYAAENNGLVPSTRRTKLKGDPIIREDVAGALLLLEGGYLTDRMTFVCPSDKEENRKLWERGKRRKLYTSYFAYRDSFTKRKDDKVWDRRLLDPDPNYGMKLPLIGDAAVELFHVTGYNTCFPDGHIEFVPADVEKTGPFENFYFK